MKKHFVGGMAGLAITISGAGSFAMAQDKPREPAEVSEMSEEGLLVAKAQDGLDVECVVDVCWHLPCSKYLDGSDEAALFEPWSELGWESYKRLIELCEETPEKPIGDFIDALPTELDKIEKKEKTSAG